MLRISSCFAVLNGISNIMNLLEKEILETGFFKYRILT